MGIAWRTLRLRVGGVWACALVAASAMAGPAPASHSKPISAEASSASPHGPDIIMLDDLEDLFQPVPFDHGNHARMSQMAGGCGICHHFPPAQGPYPPCRSCHEVGSTRQDISKPGLKGAYHRQCINCHRDWSGTADCRVCHEEKAEHSAPTPPHALPSVDDILGRMHPPIHPPEGDFFQRQTPAGTSKILFGHATHTDRFGLKCAECHREDSCRRCHMKDAPGPPRPRSQEERHRPCAACHDVTDNTTCTKCHWSEGKPKPAPFDHADTGWPLRVHHEKVSCRQCHKTIPFAGVNRTCSACHGQGAVARFHQRALSDKSRRCADCHTPPSQAVVHMPAAAGLCTRCHKPDANEQHGISVATLNTQCLACHQELADTLSQSTSRHTALATGCTTCHSAHSSPHPKLLFAPVEKICHGCHAAFLGQAPRPHTPKLTGQQCLMCHDAHASPRPSLLR